MCGNFKSRTGSVCVDTWSVAVAGKGLRKGGKAKNSDGKSAEVLELICRRWWGP